MERFHFLQHFGRRRIKHLDQGNGFGGISVQCFLSEALRTLDLATHLRACIASRTPDSSGLFELSALLVRRENLLRQVAIRIALGTYESFSHGREESVRKAPVSLFPQRLAKTI